VRKDLTFVPVERIDPMPSLHASITRKTATEATFYALRPDGSHDAPMVPSAHYQRQTRQDNDPERGMNVRNANRAQDKDYGHQSPSFARFWSHSACETTLRENSSRARFASGGPVRAFPSTSRATVSSTRWCE
jgi:hypothetical protein